MLSRCGLMALPRLMALLSLSTFLWLPVCAQAAEDWQVTRNLAHEAAEAENGNKILVVYVTMEGCPYCRQLEADLLTAAWQRGELKDAHLVEVMWDTGDLVNFDGESESVSDFMTRYGIKVTPTMLFLGSHGEELSDQLIGYKSQDFYWQYLRASIDVAREWIEN